MHQTHHPLRSLNSTEFPDKNVQALFATKPDSRAILFIHGYGGDPVKTWSEFHDLLPEQEHFSGVDLLFYGYDSLQAEMIASAALFHEFLDRLFSDGVKVINSSLPSKTKRPSSFKYTKLLVVAHSLGAVIARRGIADATSARAKWTTKTSLALFAPAHMGAVAVELALEAASGFKFMSLFSSGAQMSSPMTRQLKPDSAELQALRSDVATLTKNRANPHLIPKMVVLAEFEKIVKNLAFPGDPAPVTIANTSHTSVCKPNRTFLKPLEIVKLCL